MVVPDVVTEAAPRVSATDVVACFTVTANVNDFVLHGEPALRKLAAAGDPGDGAGGAGDPDVVHFEKMSASFTRSAGRLDLREAVIFNSHMGLTTQGYLDYAHNHVDLNGTFIPAYQVNTLVTHIPVVGLLLGGGAHEGVFGLNYRIVGLLEEFTLYFATSAKSRANVAVFIYAMQYWYIVLFC